MNHEENVIEYEIQLTPLALEMLEAVKEKSTITGKIAIASIN
ncbi:MULTISPECIES: hypothetical protein [unclassified Microcoleus]